MKAPAPLLPLVQPKSSASPQRALRGAPVAPVQAVGEGVGDRMRSVLAELAAKPVQAKAAVDPGYGELVEAARLRPSGGATAVQRAPNHAASRAADQPAGISALPAIDPPQPGLNKPGFIDHSDGANIRTRPAEFQGVALTVTPLPPATRVFVSGQHPQTPQWLYVSAFLPTAIVRGYVQHFRVTMDLPEPSAKLYQIKSGDTAERLAVQEFSAAVRDGHDLRYYENVLLAVNRDKNRAGINGTFQDPNILGGGSNNIQLEAGHRIWLVSPAYARALEGKVPDGSLTNGLYAKAKRVIGHLEDIVQSVTDSPRYFGDVAGEYAEAIKAHIPEIVGITAGFILAESASAFLAATPTGVGQIVAVLIQLALAAFGAKFAIDAGIEALRHGEQWLSLAWTANGDPKQLAAASKEFLKMLVSVAMAALAIAGIRGNIGKGLKIAEAIKIEPPSMGLVPAPVGGGIPGGAVFTPGSIATTGPVDIRPSMMSAIGSGGSTIDPGKSPEPQEAAPKDRQPPEPSKQPAAPSTLKQILGREPTLWEQKLFSGRTPAEIAEMQRALEGWAKRTYESEAHSVFNHAYRKGYDALKLLRKVAAFNRRGARRVPSQGFSDTGTYKLEKPNGEYLILEGETNKVVTYGEN